MAAILAAALSLVPEAANAQRQPFIDHLITFRTLLFGPYGDEGEHIIEKLEQLTGALAVWNDAVRAQEKKLRGEDRSAAAMLLVDAGRLSDALIALDAALKEAPGQRHLQTLRGRLLEGIGRETEAAGAYRNAWELDRSDAVNAYLAFSMPAAPDASESGPLGALVAAHRRLASQAAERSGVELFRDLQLIPDRAAKTPVFAPAAYADGFEAIATGNYVQALTRLRAAAARDPLIIDRASQSKTMSLGIARLRAGMLNDAIAPLEATVLTYRDSSEAHRILGTAYAAVGEYARAAERLRRAVNLAPADERSRLALARVLRDAGRLDDAAQSLNETLAAMPRSSEARWMLGDIMEKAGRGVDAARELEAAAAATVIAGKSVLLRRAAETYGRHQNFDRQLDLLQRSARTAPNDPAVHRQLGLALSRLGHSDRAFAELAIADLLGGADAESLTTIGQIHLEAGRLEDAARVSQRAIALQSDLPETRYVLGRALLRLGRVAEAREHLDAFQRLRARAMENQRRDFEIDALRVEATVATAAGRHDRAAAVWRRIIERRPLDPQFHVAAAEALAASGEHLDAAMEFEKAASLGAGPVVQRRLAEVYAQLGRQEESEQARRSYEQKVKELLKVQSPAHP